MESSRISQIESSLKQHFKLCKTPLRDQRSNNTSFRPKKSNKIQANLRLKNIASSIEVQNKYSQNRNNICYLLQQSNSSSTRKLAVDQQNKRITSLAPSSQDLNIGQKFNTDVPLQDGVNNENILLEESFNDQIEVSQAERGIISNEESLSKNETDEQHEGKNIFDSQTRSLVTDINQNGKASVIQLVRNFSTVATDLHNISNKLKTTIEEAKLGNLLQEMRQKKAFSFQPLTNSSKIDKARQSTLDCIGKHTQIINQINQRNIHKLKEESIYNLQNLKSSFQKQSHVNKRNEYFTFKTDEKPVPFKQKHDLFIDQVDEFQSERLAGMAVKLQDQQVQAILQDFLITSINPTGVLSMHNDSSHQQIRLNNSNRSITDVQAFNVKSLSRNASNSLSNERQNFMYHSTQKAIKQINKTPDFTNKLKPYSEFFKNTIVKRLPEDTKEFLLPKKQNEKSNFTLQIENKKDWTPQQIQSRSQLYQVQYQMPAPLVLPEIKKVSFKPIRNTKKRRTSPFEKQKSLRSTELSAFQTDQGQNTDFISVAELFEMQDRNSQQQLQETLYSQTTQSQHSDLNYFTALENHMTPQLRQQSDRSQFGIKKGKQKKLNYFQSLPHDSEKPAGLSKSSDGREGEIQTIMQEKNAQILTNNHLAHNSKMNLYDLKKYKEALMILKDKDEDIRNRSVIQDFEDFLPSLTKMNQKNLNGQMLNAVVHDLSLQKQIKADGTQQIQTRQKPMFRYSPVLETRIQTISQTLVGRKLISKKKTIVNESSHNEEQIVDNADSYLTQNQTQQKIQSSIDLLKSITSENSENGSVYQTERESFNFVVQRQTPPSFIFPKNQNLRESFSKNNEIKFEVNLQKSDNQFQFDISPLQSKILPKISSLNTYFGPKHLQSPSSQQKQNLIQIESQLKKKMSRFAIQETKISEQGTQCDNAPEQVKIIKRFSTDLYPKTNKISQDSMRVNDMKKNFNENIHKKPVKDQSHFEIDYVSFIKQMHVKDHLEKFGVKKEQPNQNHIPNFQVETSTTHQQFQKQSPKTNTLKGSRESLLSIELNQKIPILNIVPQVIHLSKRYDLGKDFTSSPKMSIQFNERLVNQHSIQSQTIDISPLNNKNYQVVTNLNLSLQMTGRNRQLTSLSLDQEQKEGNFKFQEISKMKKEIKHFDQVIRQHQDKTKKQQESPNMSVQTLSQGNTYFQSTFGRDFKNKPQIRCINLHQPSLQRIQVGGLSYQHLRTPSSNDLNSPKSQKASSPDLQCVMVDDQHKNPFQRTGLSNESKMVLPDQLKESQRNSSIFTQNTFNKPNTKNI